MNQADTKMRILDAAEDLFARKGYHNTSLRAITGKAKVNLAAVNYHFGGKEALVEAIFLRRLTPLNLARRQRLDAVRDQARSEARSPRIDEVLRAFIEPTLAFRDADPGARSFIAFVGRALSEPDGIIHDAFMGHMAPLIFYMMELCHAALPELSRQSTFWRLFFSLSAVGQTICMLDKPLPWPPGVTALADADALLAEIMPFLTAGMEACP